MYLPRLQPNEPAYIAEAAGFICLGGGGVVCVLSRTDKPKILTKITFRQLASRPSNVKRLGEKRLYWQKVSYPIKFKCTYPFCEVTVDEKL